MRSTSTTNGVGKVVRSAILCSASTLALTAFLAACAAHPVPPPNQFGANQPLTAVPVTPPPGPSASASPEISGRVVPEPAPPGPGPVVHVASPQSNVSVTPIADQQGDVTLNFANTDVREVVDAVLGKTLGLSYDIDPKVTGTVTLQSAKPIAKSAVLPALESVLASAGVALTHTGPIYHVVPMANAAHGATTADTSNGNISGYGVQAIPLRYTTPSALKKVLDPFVPTGGVLEADDAHQTLIVSGAAGDREAFTKLVATFDIDQMAGMSFGMYPLRQGDATTVARDLTTILKNQGRDAATVRVVPIERVNSILLVSPQPRAIDQARDWMERLDDGPDEANAQLYVYFVQNSRATDLAKVLGSLFSNGGGGGGGNPSTAPGSTMSKVSLPPASPFSSTGSTPGNGAATPTGGSGAPQDNGATASNASTNPDQPMVFGGDDDQSGGGTAGQSDSGQGVRIVADEKNNAIVIRARPSEYRLIDAALKRLDVLAQQVLIEATVAEVTLNDQLNYGLQWYFQNHASTISNTTSTTSQLPNIPVPGFNWVLAGANAQAVLSALSSVTNVNIVSAPQLMVLDHQTATLEVGDEVPVATQQAVSTLTANAPLISTIQQEETGVILQVTPRINNNGTATLDIQQEVSQANATTSSTINSPTISKRKITTEVAVADGQTIALGGMIQDQKTRGKDGLPVLGSIPVVGNLFSTTSDQHQRTELLILLTPRIVHDQAEARDVTAELQSRLSTLPGLQPTAH